MKWNKYFWFFFFGSTCGMWKFLGQGANLHHSKHPSLCSDNARSLTHCITRGLQKWNKYLKFCILFFFFFFFLELHMWHMEVPRLRFSWIGGTSAGLCHSHSNAEGIQAASATYTTACGNTRSLTHWVRPGIKSASSQTLCWVLNLLSYKGNSLYSFVLK